MSRELAGYQFSATANFTSCQHAALKCPNRPQRKFENWSENWSPICKAWDPGWVRFDTKYVENNYLTQTYDFISLTECQVNICSWQDFWGIFIFSNSWANAYHSFETWTPRRHEKCTVKHIRKPYVSYRIKTCKIRPWLLATATRILWKPGYFAILSVSLKVANSILRMCFDLAQKQIRITTTSNSQIRKSQVKEWKCYSRLKLRLMLAETSPYLFLAFTL